MSKRTYIILAVIIGAIGTSARIVAYLNTPTCNVPEWVYDLDSTAYALETLWPYLLTIAACKYLPRIKLLHLAKLAAIIYSYVGLFDFSKEVVGVNAGGGWTEILMFSIGLSLILLFQYHVYRYYTTTD